MGEEVMVGEWTMGLRTWAWGRWDGGDGGCCGDKGKRARGKKVDEERERMEKGELLPTNFITRF